MKTAIIIATGDELSKGDILNTTTPLIAEKLTERGLDVLYHLIVPDDETKITQAISDACSISDYVFTTGGLGPTSDDRTRFALAKALKKELVFDESIWKEIQRKIKRYHQRVPDSNKQQAYFPKDATVLNNERGSADACHIHHAGCDIFMLPGPPRECIPIFDHYVLPKLPDEKQYKLHWLLLGCSESEIAEKIEASLKRLPCQISYRADYPYLELKVFCNNAAALTECEQQLLPLLSEHLASQTNKAASTQLLEKLSQTQIHLTIYDEATGGALQARLLTPNTQKLLKFTEPQTANNLSIHTHGLNEYWQQNDAKETTLNLTIGKKEFQHTLRLYPNLRTYAVEWICWKILTNLTRTRGKKT